jgi:cation:H+ antiporter
MTTDILTILAGIVLVLGLSEVVVRNAIALAHRYRLSGGFIGLTILSVGTSIPEIMTHIVASSAILRQPESLDTLSALVVGANIGSDIFQQNFVLPVAGLIGTIMVVRSELHEQMGALTAAAILVWLFGLGGLITRLEGALLVVSYVGYLLFLASRNHLAGHISTPDGAPHAGRVWVQLGLIVLCFVLIAVVSDRVVGAAERLVEMLPLSASFFGVLFLGMATALPELSTALVSISKGEKGLSAGVLIGSNVTNPLLGIGTGAMISQYSVPNVVTLYDLPVKILTAVVLYVFLLYQENLTRREALTLIVMFLLYLVARSRLFPEDVLP